MVAHFKLSKGHSELLDIIREVSHTFRGNQFNCLEIFRPVKVKSLGTE